MAKPSFKRTAAFVAAFGIALAPATAGIALAQAPSDTSETISEPLTPVVDGSPVFTQETGTLTIHKVLNPDSTGAPTGNSGDEDTYQGGEAVQGVSFKVTPLNYDLSDPVEFKEAAALTANNIPEGKLGTPVNHQTNDSGVIELLDLPIGAYLVEEQDSPEAKTVPDGEVVTGLVKSPAFIAFVPMTNPANQGEWNYDVHVFPKNTTITTDKTVVDKDQNVGGTVAYEISTGIPNINEGDQFNEYVVHDSYDADELEDMTVTKVTVGSTELTTDQYTVIPGTADGEGAVTDQIKITDLDVLASNAGGTVTVELTATIKSLADGKSDGQVENTAKNTGIIGRGDGTTTPFEGPNDEVITYLAQVQINKFDANNTETKLSGAVFKLYQSAECTEEALKEKTPLTVNGVSEWKTVEGVVTIDGLHVSDFVNNNEPPTTQDGYCLVETVAPAGYSLLTTPISVPLTREDATNDGVYTALHEVDVPNVDETVDTLPSTGGMGVGLIIAVGAGLIGAGAYAARRNSQTA